MTTYTLSDLATRVLRDLGITEAREQPDPSDLAWAEQTTLAVTAQLAAERIFIWNGSAEALPEEYLVILSKRIGLDVGPSFGLFTIADAERAKPVVNNTLRSINAPQPTGSVSESEYF